MTSFGHIQAKRWYRRLMLQIYNHILFSINSVDYQLQKVKKRIVVHNLKQENKLGMIQQIQSALSKISFYHSTIQTGPFWKKDSFNQSLQLFDLLNQISQIFLFENSDLIYQILQIFLLKSHCFEEEQNCCKYFFSKFRFNVLPIFVVTNLESYFEKYLMELIRQYFCSSRPDFANISAQNSKSRFANNLGKGRCQKIIRDYLGTFPNMGGGCLPNSQNLFILKIALNHPKKRNKNVKKSPKI